MAEFTSLNGYAVKDSVARSIAKGRNQAVAFTDYATMIEALNEYEKDEYKAGQNVYIGVVGVPDLWVYSVEDIRHTFIYESDDDIVDKLKNNTTVQVGFFKLAMLEGQKVDLTTYDQHLAKHDDDISVINESLGGVVETNTTSLSLETAVAYMCDNYMKTNNMSYNGKFVCADGHFTYNAYYSGGWHSGFISGVGTNNSYTFYRQAGADAVLKELGKVKLTLLGNERSYNIANIVGADKINLYDNSDFFVTYGQGSPFTRITLFSYSGETDFTWSYDKNSGILTVSGGVATYSYSDRGYDVPATMNLLPAVYMFQTA